jgi:hypothetical protein
MTLYLMADDGQILVDYSMSGSEAARINAGTQRLSLMLAAGGVFDHLRWEYGPDRHGRIEVPGFKGERVEAFEFINVGRDDAGDIFASRPAPAPKHGRRRRG